MISSTPKGPYIGMDQSRVPPAPPDQTVGSFVKFLRAQLPNFAIGRYPYARRVVYLVNRNLLAWRHDPLNQKLSFHGTMSLSRLESHVLSKLVPTVHFYNIGPPRLISGSGSGAVMFPEPESFKVPMHFDIKAMTLRRFLKNRHQVHARPGRDRPATVGCTRFRPATLECRSILWQKRQADGPR